MAPAADGSTRLFDVDIGGDGVRVPAAETRGVRVNDVAWSPAAHVVCVASADARKPVALKASVEGRPAIEPPARANGVGILGRPGAPTTAAAIKKSREAAGFASSARGRADPLPAELTPDAVREMLRRIRVDAQRERTQAKEDFQRQRMATPRGAGGYQTTRSPAAAAPYGLEKENAAAASGFDAGKRSFDPYGGPGGPSVTGQGGRGEGYGLSSMGYGSGGVAGGSSAGVRYGLGSELGAGALSNLSPVG